MVRPFIFPALTIWGTRGTLVLCLSERQPFFAVLTQRGELRSAERGDSPRPAAGQEGRHQGFYPLNSHFLLFLSLAQTRDRRPLRKRERQSGYSCVSFSTFSQFTDSVLLHRWFTLRRRGIAVPRNS